MSMGYGAVARLLGEENQTVIYEYGAFNLNEDKYRNDNYEYDGLIVIEKHCFPKPEVHEKIKRMPNGRKKLIHKIIPAMVPIGEYIRAGIIRITNSKYCWKISDDSNIHVGWMAFRIIHKIFNEYQVKGKYPEKPSIFC